MNKERRKNLQRIIDGLYDLKCDLENLQEEEQESFDNIPEGLQESERGQQIEENADSLSECIDELDSLLDNLQNIVG